MSISIKDRRKQTRHPVSRAKEASVEFRYPGERGRAYRLPILNISASGLSFGLGDAEELNAFEEGTQLTEVVVRVEGCTMRGELLVMHVTDGSDSGYVCGALFYPATDTDLVKLRSLIAGMEVAGTD